MQRLFLLVLISALSLPALAQCPDARAKRYANMTGNNYQACSQCATLALYLCGAQYAVKPQDVAKYRELIAQLKSNLRFMAPNNCCPEMLGEQPRFGVKAKGGSSSSAGGGGSMINTPQWVKDIETEDLVELGEATVAAVQLGAMTLQVIDEIFPDVNNAYRDVAKQFNYHWEKQAGAGNGTGLIQMAEPTFIFEGKIKNGYPSRGKMKMGQYGLYQGQFNNDLSAVVVTESEMTAGMPTVGRMDLNFGVSHIIEVDYNKGLWEFYFEFENGDQLRMEKKGMRKYMHYLPKGSSEDYKIKLKDLKEPDFDEIADEFPTDDETVRANLCRYYLATAARVLSQPIMLGRDVRHEWWQDQVDPFLVGAQHFLPEGQGELAFWYRQINEDAGYQY